MPESLALQYDDYAQSANMLFYFTTKSDYLKTILRNKSIAPRYCMENIDYLNLCAGGIKFREAAVLQKLSVILVIQIAIQCIFPKQDLKAMRKQKWNQVL